MHEYTANFFDFIQQGSRRSAAEIIPLVLNWIRPRRVIDVGCGTGTWLSVFAEHGVEEILGVDGDWVDPEGLQIPKDFFLSADLRQPLCLNREFDLVVSLEVAEHLPNWCAETFVKSLTRLGPVILFSAAIPFQGGVGHLNERWPEYWAKHFLMNGYVAIDCIRNRVWKNDNVAWWFAQNALLFVKQDRLPKYPLLASEYLQGAALQLSVIHPRNYLLKANLYASAVNPETMSLKNVLLKLPAITKHTLRRKMRQLQSRSYKKTAPHE